MGFWMRRFVVVSDSGVFMLYLDGDASCIGCIQVFHLVFRYVGFILALDVEVSYGLSMAGLLRDLTIGIPMVSDMGYS